MNGNPTTKPMRLSSSSQASVLRQYRTAKAGCLRLRSARRSQKGDQDAVDKINKQQLNVARDALKMYKE